MNDWVSFARSKLVLSSVAISCPLVLSQHVPNSQCPGSIQARSTRTIILHFYDILSWAPVPGTGCRSTGLCGAIKADLDQRSSFSTRKSGATCTQLWIEWLPQRVPSNGERLYQKLKRMSDMLDSPMGIGLNGRSVKRFLFTLLTTQADILFAEEAVRLSVEQFLTFFSNDSPRDDLWVKMTLLLERSQSQSRR